MPMAEHLQRQYPYPRLAGGDLWAEDPGCYLSDEEIGVTVLPEINCVAL